MIAKVQPAKKHTSNARRLQEYLTNDRAMDEQNSNNGGTSSFENLHNYLTNKETGNGQKRRLRGDVILSNNLISLETAAIEMEGTAANNFRCKDPILHYELAWPHDEHPTKAQWVNAAQHTLKALKYDEHQFLIVAHEDKQHFHIHVMVNKVHPETFKVNNPYRNWITLDKTIRMMEAKYGWKRTLGLTRWDDVTQEAVELKPAERRSLAGKWDRPTSNAARFEHYRDTESLQTYIRKVVSPAARSLLAKTSTRWADLHSLLAKAHLRIERGEKGGYTVVSVDYGIRVKASDVFRNDFAGKANRERVEQALGPWVPAHVQELQKDAAGTDHTLPADRTRLPVRGDDSAAKLPQNSSPTSTRHQTSADEDRRAQRRRLRDERRRALKAEYTGYRNGHMAVCKQITAEGSIRQQQLVADLRMRKQKIRANDAPWVVQKALLSQEVAQSVLEARALKQATQEKRKAAWPQTYREWVADRAAEGDTRAAAQLRGWYYQDQRNHRKLEARLEHAALHLRPAGEKEGESLQWEEFAGSHLEAQKRESLLKRQIDATQIWKIDRRTGDVSYALNGKVSVVDRGRVVSVLNSEEATILFGLEMSIKKYGTRLACTGSTEWKKNVASIVVRHGIPVHFTDSEMERMKAQLRVASNHAGQRRPLQPIFRTRTQISR